MANHDSADTHYYILLALSSLSFSVLSGLEWNTGRHTTPEPHPLELSTRIRSPPEL